MMNVSIERVSVATRDLGLGKKQLEVKLLLCEKTVFRDLRLLTSYVVTNGEALRLRGQSKLIF